MLPKIARVLPLNKKDAVIAGDIVSFQLPDGILDLSSINLWMNATISNSTANNQSLPRDVETLVEHLWITVDGEEVQRIQNYNQVFRTLWDSEQSYDDNRKRAMLSSGAYIMNGLNNTAYDYASRPVCMTKWYGLLGSKTSNKLH